MISGLAGGSCTCPDGSYYQVGVIDKFSIGTAFNPFKRQTRYSATCAEAEDGLACYGGTAGTCLDGPGLWSFNKVTCAGYSK